MPRTLRLSGERRRGRHAVYVDNADPIWVTSSSFVLLCRLANARLNSVLGYVRCDPLGGDEMNPVSIHRLRTQLGDPALIIVGAVREYRIEASVEVDPTFKELPSGLLSPSLFGDLTACAQEHSIATRVPG